MRLALNWTHGLKVDMSMRYQNTVARMNVGRVILEKLAYGLLGIAEAQEELVRARDAKELEFADIDPRGDGLLDVR